MTTSVWIKSELFGIKSSSGRFSFYIFITTSSNVFFSRSQRQKETAAALADKNTEASAIVIQKIWRGYRTRKVSQNMAEKIMKMRTQEYIE